MTPEEVVRRAFDAFNERGLEAATPFWHPNIHYHEAPDFPGAGSYHGRDAVEERFAEYVELLGTTRTEVDQAVVRGDRIAFTVRFSGRSAEGVPNSHTWGYVARLEDGMLAEVHAYYDAAEALAAV
jgi:ketosteroid isomerase-like protein